MSQSLSQRWWPNDCDRVALALAGEDAALVMNLFQASITTLEMLVDPLDGFQPGLDSFFSVHLTWDVNDPVVCHCVILPTSTIARALAGREIFRADPRHGHHSLGDVGSGRVHVDHESPDRTGRRVDSDWHRVWAPVSAGVDENQPACASTFSPHVGRELVYPSKLPLEDFEFDEVKHAGERHPDVNEADSGSDLSKH